MSKDDRSAADGGGIVTTVGDRTGEPFEPPIEPGAPTVENAVFVLLGVLLALVVVWRIVQLFG